MPAPTVTTELDALNEMLARIGELPVATTESTGLADVVLGLDTLRRESRRFQSKGWHWNTDKGRVLARNESNEIVLPAGTVSVDTVDEDSYINVVQRGSRLYDTENHRYTFDKNLKVNITVLLPFDELPEIVRNYITVKASRVFSAGNSGAEGIPQFTREDEYDLLAAVKREESRNADRNILNNPSVSYVRRRAP